MAQPSQYLPLGKIFDTIFTKPTPGSEIINVTVYRRPDYSELDTINKPVFFDDLYATSGPTARNMRDGAGNSSM
jgi:hypothetical protein